jgi:hypothetical protein
MSDISEHGANFIRDLGEAARQNPVSAVLIGVGVFWMLSGRGTAGKRASEVTRRSGLHQFRDDAGEALDAAGPALRSRSKSMRTGIGSVAEQVHDGATEAFDSASRFGREQADTAYEYVRSVPETGMEMMQNACTNLAEIFRTQPLALGAIGVAIGAGIAAALPPTEVETDYLGETSDAFKEGAQALLAEQATRTAAAAESAIGAAAEEARNQGLTIEDAKFAAIETSAKVGRVLSAAGKKASKGGN